MNTSILNRLRITFLEKVAAHFNSTNRAVNAENRCTYSHNTNGGCAIGRECSYELAEDLHMNYSSLAASSDEIFHSLPPHLQILGRRFLQSIQDFHDMDFYWTTNGPSVLGHRRIYDICREVNDEDLYVERDDAEIEKTLISGE